MDNAEPEPLVPLGEDPRDVEKTLQQLRPRPLNLDREQLMYLAGLEAGSEKRAARDRLKYWIWPAATAGMTAVAASLLVALSLQLSRPPVERVVVVREVVAPAPPPTVPAEVKPPADPPQTRRYASAPFVSFPSNSALQMRNLALRLGVEALPAAGNSPPASPADKEPANHWQQLREAMEPREPGM